MSHRIRNLSVVAGSVLLVWSFGCRSESQAARAEKPAGDAPTVVLGADESKTESRASTVGAASKKETEISDMKTETATFAAGCFWGVEHTFRQVEGVVSTRVGFTGGHVENPSYRDVCYDRTGHAEAVEVVFNPEAVSYDDLLDVFWKCHNPTTLNRQGPDVGEQYRSVIFYHNVEQETAARASKERLQKSGTFEREIVTEITPASTFYEAEEYHQNYLAKHGRASCATTLRDD